MINLLRRFLEVKTNGPETASLLASILNIRISDTTLTKEIEEHPDYPSLLSISDVLNKYGIDTLGLKFELQKIQDLPTPFITQIASRTQPMNLFTVVKDTANGIHFYDTESHRWSSLSKEEFLKRCSGIALLAEPREIAGEKDYKLKLAEERRLRLQYYSAILFVPLTIILLGIKQVFSIGVREVLPFLYSIVILFGCFSTSLLLWYEYDQYNPLLRKICSSGKKSSCQAILTSKASKIAGVSWSIIGFTYFTGLSLFILFSSPLDSISLLVLSIFSFMAVPYIVFSIYYQSVVAKQWCTLCLSVQLALSIAAGIAIGGNWINSATINDLNFNVVIKVMASFGLPLFTMLLLMPAFQRAKQNKRLNRELQSIKHNPQIFEALLQKQREITEVPVNLGITLGNPEATYRIIKVCNPYCGPCAEIHKPMEHLLHQCNNLQLNVLYTASNDPNDERTPPVRHILAIAEQNDNQVLSEALDDWYLSDVKDYETFARKYPMNGELTQQNEKIEAMAQWCKRNEITYTPTLFIALPGQNGNQRYFEIPGEYSFEDLGYFFSV